MTNTAALDPSPRDETIPVGEDFYHHVNARWLAANPVLAAAARMLANTDTHAPSRFRVNGPLSNTPAFAAAFGIPEGRRWRSRPSSGPGSGSRSAGPAGRTQG